MTERQIYADYLITEFRNNPKTSWGKNELVQELMRLERDYLRKRERPDDDAH